MTLRDLVSAGVLFSLGIMVGRLLGLPREMLIAARFGTGEDANIAISLLIIPDFINAALVGGALGATLIPAFTSRSPERVQALFWQTLVASTLASGFIAVLIALFVPGANYHSAMMLALSTLPLIGATSVFTAYLQYLGRFEVPAFASAIFNIVILLILWLAPSGLIILGIGIIAAASIRLLAHMLAYKRAGGLLRPSWGKSLEIDRPLLSSYLHTSGASLLGILPFYIPYGLVALLSIGGFAVFNYAFKLLLFPATLVQSTIQMVLLPWFVRRRAESNHSPLERYKLSLQLGWATSLAVSLAVTIAAQDIAKLCFGYGEMTPEAVHAVGLLIAIGIWSTPGIVLLAIYQQMLYAHEKPKLVFFANALIVLLVFFFGIIGDLVKGEVGIMAGFVVGQTAPVFILAFMVNRHVGAALHHALRYVHISVAIIAVYLPLAWLYVSIEHNSVLGVVLAMLIGGISLMAGLLQIPAVKDKYRALMASI
ncbi:MAG: hypothetical protein LW823_07130 [Rickettsiales bacterium]|jgi:putative peptidoglycan lipid II flippase|nr:hypothetical protein [Rickettsiales bacterium]